MKKIVMMSVMVVLMALNGSSLFAGKASAKTEQLAVVTQYLNLMKDYLTLSDKWMTMVKDDDTAVFLAADSIANIYKEKGNKAAAIPRLRKLLKKYKSQKVVCRAILFKIKDIYKDEKEYDKALKVLDEIIDLD
ncbi:MAG: hypothetical protein L3J71_15845 [Victivallaceae bacterium]|nr:hypothetical protein [Victivallaceae bacterium]